MDIDEFRYDLPEHLIAQYPPSVRDASRLMVLDRRAKSIDHCQFSEIGQFLAAGDTLVLNRTRVIPARLRGQTTVTGGKIELLLIRDRGDGEWLAIGRPGKRLRTGVHLCFGDEVAGEVLETSDGGRCIVKFDRCDIAAILCKIGEVPLPPYIRRDPDEQDKSRYQTVYAKDPGAVAAPTAGLHFTENLLQQLVESGVRLASVLLHVGPATFAPVRVSDPRQHVLEPEYFEIDGAAAADLNQCRKEGGRIVAVGTTTVRTLETGAADSEQVSAATGWTSKLIYPPYRFRAVDTLLTNFHLPCSTLLMMVAAFAGTEFALNAYRIAVKNEYRFYSYGDAMLIL
jgi:S-adenosylmethionine:tRNA ribosyltransferase-isomerase